jgi:hypothetical protein
MRSRAKSPGADVKNRRTSKKQEQKVAEKLRGATVRATDRWEIAIPETFDSAHIDARKPRTDDIEITYVNIADGTAKEFKPVL